MRTRSKVELPSVQEEDPELEIGRMPPMTLFGRIFVHVWRQPVAAYPSTLNPRRLSFRLRENTRFQFRRR
jgi:hypothetical protein